MEKQVFIACNDFILESKLENKRLHFKTIVAGIVCVKPIESSNGSAAVQVLSDELEIDDEELREIEIAVDSAGGSVSKKF